MGRQRGTNAAAEQWQVQSAVDIARRLPHHFRPISDLPTLTERERESMAQCEAAVESLQLVFWAAGKALQIIRDGKLYRQSHQTFEAYLLARWSMKRAYANKLIRTWQIAERLFEAQSSGLAPIGAKKLNQASAWELVPVAEQHGLDAAENVYTTVVEVNGEPTAAVIKQAVQALPSGDFEPEVAKAAIVGELKKERQPKAPRLPKARQEPQPQAPTVPWEDPAAVFALLREHMTAERRAALAELLVAELSEESSAA
ncbi:hypothetical protein [Kitasatospora sp. NPDC001132]